jgi:hypothetical protein
MKLLENVEYVYVVYSLVDNAPNPEDAKKTGKTAPKKASQDDPIKLDIRGLHNAYRSLDEALRSVKKNASSKKRVVLEYKVSSVFTLK